MFLLQSSEEVRDSILDDQRKDVMSLPIYEKIKDYKIGYYTPGYNYDVAPLLRYDPQYGQLLLMAIAGAHQGETFERDQMLQIIKHLCHAAVTCNVELLLNITPGFSHARRGVVYYLAIKHHLPGTIDIKNIMQVLDILKENPNVYRQHGSGCVEVQTTCYYFIHSFMLATLPESVTSDIFEICLDFLQMPKASSPGSASVTQHILAPKDDRTRTPVVDDDSSVTGRGKASPGVKPKVNIPPEEILFPWWSAHINTIPFSLQNKGSRTTPPVIASAPKESTGQATPGDGSAPGDSAAAKAPQVITVHYVA